MKNWGSLAYSKDVSCVLIAVLAAALAADYVVHADDAAKGRDLQRDEIEFNQVTAITQAVEQYLIDFPSDELLVNNRVSTMRFAGFNARSVKYLKTQRFSRDAFDRMVDSDGLPYLLDKKDTEKAQADFRVSSSRGIGAFGWRKQPHYPRSY